MGKLWPLPEVSSWASDDASRAVVLCGKYRNTQGIIGVRRGAEEGVLTSTVLGVLAGFTEEAAALELGFDG